MTGAVTFEGRYANDTRYLGYMLDGINDYVNSPLTVLEVLQKSPRDVVAGYLADPMALGVIESYLAAVPAGATPVDNDTVMQYANQLLVLVNDVDAANQGVEEENALDRGAEIQRRLEDTSSQLTALLQPAQDYLDQIPVDTNGTGLASYLLTALETGGCNNVFAEDARRVLQPLAQYGYQTPAQQIRTYLQTEFGV